MFSHGDDEQEVELQRKLFSSNIDVFSYLNPNIPKTYSQGTKSGILQQFYLLKSNFKRKITENLPAYPRN